MAEHLAVSELVLGFYYRVNSANILHKKRPGETLKNEEETKKIKRDLEGWREIILPINSVLLWERNLSVAIIFGTTTAIFCLFWRHNISVLSSISLLGIIITIIDYLAPTLTLHICHPERWTSVQERKLETICRSLAANKIYLVNCLRSFYQMRRDRPACYYSVVITALFVLSWIGNAVDNLLLTYIIVTGLLLLPGMLHHGVIDKYTASIKKIIMDRAGSSTNLKSE